MRRNGRLLIVLGVVLLLGALLLAVFALAGGDDDEPGSGDTSPQDVTVVRARRDIDAHTVLRRDDVEEVTVRDDTITGDEARTVGEVIGFAYSSDLVEGQRLMRAGLEVSGIAEELEPGTRAISIPVTRNNTVAGLIRQDDRIDIAYQISVDMIRVSPTRPFVLPDQLTIDEYPFVLEGYEDIFAYILELEEFLGADEEEDEEGEEGEEQPGTAEPADFPDFPDGPVYEYPGDPGSRFAVSESGAGNPVVKLVLQNVRVLRVISPASDAAAGDDEEFLVLEVTPEQAELLHMMQSAGTYHVMLRGTDDTSTANTPGMSIPMLIVEFGMPVPGTVTLPGGPEGE